MVHPDAARPILAVDVYYTQHGKAVERASDRENVMNRFWRHAETIESRDAWAAELPLGSVDKPLWVYANVTYALDEPVSGAGYYYRIYAANRFNVSSLLGKASPDQLKAAGVKATLKRSLLIESFEGDWEKEWFTYRPEAWARQTHKVHAEQWKAPAGARLALDVRSNRPNKLVVGMDQYATEVGAEGAGEWQTVELAPTDFENALGEKLQDWNDIRELRLGPKETLRSRKRGEESKLTLGGDWEGANPEFRNLRWVAR